MTDATADHSPDLPPERWDAVREFTEAVVAEASPHVPYSDGELMYAVSRLAVWSRVTVGPSLPRESVLSLRNIERFTHSGMADVSDATRATVRSRLRRVSEALVAPRAVGVVPVKQNTDPIAPYSVAEVAEIIAWAQRLSTEQRRNDAMVLLALGLGAGLAAGEIGDLRVRDIIANDEGVVVDADGPRPRSVPVLGRWERVLSTQLTRPADEFLFRPNREGSWPNLISNFVTQSKGKVRPRTQRMRATWIVEQLDAWVPARTLLEAAGVDSLEALARYVKYTRPIDPELARGVLRGPTSVQIEL